MKKWIIGFVIVLFCSNVFAADQIITIKIPDAKVVKALEGFLMIYPNNETIADPAWIDPEDGSEAPWIPKYTNKEWVAEKVRRIIVRDVRRGLQMKATQEAQVEKDDGVAVIE